MSPELRPPLNSLLLLARLLADNPERNLTEKTIALARTTHSAGSDLLSLIDDILDLSKIEAGRMDVEPDQVDFDGVRSYVEQAFTPQPDENGLEFGGARPRHPSLRPPSRGRTRPCRHLSTCRSSPPALRRTVTSSARPAGNSTARPS